MAQATTTPADAVQVQAPAPRRPTMEFRRGATMVRAVPVADGWRVEGTDAALVRRISAALRRPIRTRVSRPAVDELDGAVQLESWVVEVQPDDPRYPYRVAHGRDRIGLGDEPFDDIEILFGA
jgi:hypothetical protein